MIALSSLAVGFSCGRFAFVMATGIVSIAAALTGLTWASMPLFTLNLVAFPTLWALLAIRIACDPPFLIAQLRDARQAPSVLTMVAATCVLGNEVVLAGGHPAAALALWVLAAVLWFGLVYGFFGLMTVRPAKPPFASGIDGSWLLAVVATEALAVLTANLAGGMAARDAGVFASLCLFLLGGAFYLFLLGAILYRWLFVPMRAADLTPAYWINMGAAAIATLAGARLLAVIGADPALAVTRNFVFSATILFWTLATWWIPLLVALTAWRHWSGEIPLAYRPANWSIVFPLGMYTTASLRFSQELGLPFLNAAPYVFVWVALAAWCFTFGGMLRMALNSPRPGANAA